MFGVGNSFIVGGLGGRLVASAPVVVDEDPDFIEPGVPSLFSMLIKPIRDADKRDGGDLLKRFLKHQSDLFKARLDSIRSLADLDAPSTVRADLLQYLKNTVGFTSDLDYITADLDANSLRRLISLAVPLWNKRATAEGLAEWVRLLTGRAVDITDWFTYRWLLGENGPGIDGSDVWLVGGEVTPMDEFTSHLRVMDRGTLDRKLLLNLVGLSRVMSERIEVAVVDFLDNFDEDRGLWTTISGTPGEISDGRFLLPASAVEEASIVVTDSLGVIVDPLAYGDHTSVHIFQIGTADDSHVVTWANWLTRPALRLTLTPFAGGGNELVLDLTNGTPIAAMDVGAFQILPAVDYELRIDHDYDPIAHQLQLMIYVDEVLVLSPLIAFASPQTGTFRLSAPGANTGVNQVDKVQVFRHPLRFAEVKPGAVTTSPNFFER